jgi:hypothetical protein
MAVPVGPFIKIGAMQNYQLPGFNFAVMSVIIDLAALVA